jgi:dienelactone hydrolase
MIPTKRSRYFTAPFLLALAAIVSTGPSCAEDIRFDALNIPVTISGSDRVELEAMVVRPDDRLPHPLVVINHGSPRSADDRPAVTPYGMWPQAVAFARRGWVAVAFLRRGYGRSGGEWAETYGSCSHPDYARAGRAGASDIAAVAKFMMTESYVSKDKWISAGHSAGAFATVALTADPPPGLAAAISFAPGRGSTSADAVCGEPQLVAAFAQYGKTSRVPLLWVSSENDHFFGSRLVPRLTGAFSAAGGNLTYIKAPSFGSDGHQLFSAADGVPVWSPIVDRFLTANHLVFRGHPMDIPTPDVAAPASLSARGRAAFKTYIESGPNKAFAVAGGQRFGWATGRRSSDEARKEALGYCASGTSEKCRIVNVNDKPAE